MRNYAMNLDLAVVDCLSHTSSGGLKHKEAVLSNSVEFPSVEFPYILEHFFIFFAASKALAKKKLNKASFAN